MVLLVVEGAVARERKGAGEGGADAAPARPEPPRGTKEADTLEANILPFPRLPHLRESSFHVIAELDLLRQAQQLRRWASRDTGGEDAGARSARPRTRHRAEEKIEPAGDENLPGKGVAPWPPGSSPDSVHQQRHPHCPGLVATVPWS